MRKISMQIKPKITQFRFKQAELLVQIFENELVGMTRVNINLEDLLDTRKTLVSSIKESLTNEEKKFLISVKKGEPKWDLLGLTGVEDLPAVKWKLMNINKMEKKKHKKALEKLRNYLEK